MRNKYAGKCFLCGDEVPEGKGWFQNIWSMSKADRAKFIGFGKWVLRCLKCKNAGNKPITNNK